LPWEFNVGIVKLLLCGDGFLGWVEEDVLLQCGLFVLALDKFDKYLKENLSTNKGYDFPEIFHPHFRLPKLWSLNFSIYYSLLTVFQYE